MADANSRTFAKVTNGEIYRKLLSIDVKVNYMYGAIVLLFIIDAIIVSHVWK